MDAWVVWSERGSAWLIASGSGYTSSLLHAGLFSENDAKRTAERLNRTTMPPDAWPFPDPLGRQI
jgi:hypothetical protein